MHRLVILSLPLLLVQCVFAQQAVRDTAAPTLHEVMARGMESTQPVLQHELLHDMVGEWSYVTLMSMPQMPPLRGSGTTSVKTIMGGRFIEIRSTSTEQDPPSESLGLMGFDSRPGHEQYFMLWLDSMGHYYTDAMGQWNQATASLTFHGQETDPSTGASSKYRQVFRFPGSDTMTCDVFVSVPGNPEEMQIVTIVYRRRGADAPASPDAGSTFAQTVRSQAGIGRAIDRIGSSSTSPAPTFTADQIESMDRVQLQRAMLNIMRARTMPEVEDATRMQLDMQYQAAMDRMRGLGSEQAGERGLDSQGQPKPPPMPAFTPEEIDLMDSADARKALMDIAGARRNPDLSVEQKKGLQSLFAAVYQQLRTMRESQPKAGETGGTSQD
ncbi:MAG: hypothetical protein CBC35_06440 [Planctomycetes bacterium TMED75]|nr:hypothetical protein [Planctomycetaceae bacterium]OUU92940.1 MAG: hypothetical protein CBC35_06440 [Planctomycetes bacterium TMED75]